MPLDVWQKPAHTVTCISRPLTSAFKKMNILTRQATTSDIPVVAELFDLYRQFYAQAADPALALSFISARLAHQESVILVAENGTQEVMGFCQLYPTFCSVEAKPIYTLYDLFVAPSARHGGVGRALLQAAQAKAAQTGRFRMDLSTAKTNTTAQSLYESLGWVRDEVFLTYSLHVKPA
jgi:ribosomal protein S18 acetylase RimI-like enzyme